MPKPKGEKIENNQPKKKTVQKKSLTQKLSDTEIKKFLDLESKKQNEVKSTSEIKHEVFHLIQDLRETEIRISEHYEINSFEARFSNPEKRRKQVFSDRSQIREKISKQLRHLIESGFSEEEIPDEMPFIPKKEIKGLIMNLP
jgi:hypothetical protein